MLIHVEQEEEEESQYNIYDGAFSSDDEIERELERQMNPSAQPLSNQEEESAGV